MSKNYIYFPSFSSGQSKDWLLKDKPMLNGVSSRFYDKSFGDKRYPYFLISAGHNYKKMTLREDMGLNDTFVIGDSGGFQIATGALKWSDDLTPQIFDWLQHNSDIAINIDIPIVGKYNVFDEALNLSKKNFDYFEKNQNGKVKYLNVIHGQTNQQIKNWYDSVRDYRFDGWSAGSATVMSISRMLYVLTLLLQNKEFSKTTDTVYLHFLGATTISHLIILKLIQDELNIHFPNVQVSTDSSSPHLATIYGTYYFDADFREQKIINFEFSKKDMEKFQDVELPCAINCPACSGLTTKHLVNFPQPAYMLMTNHNLYTFIWIQEKMIKILNQHDELIENSFGKDIIMLKAIIKSLFSTSNPLDVYNKNLSFYDKFKSTTRSITNTDIKKLFTF